MLDNSPGSLSRAILQTIVYSDIFNYPLRISEIHRYLAGIRTSLEEVARVLGNVGFITRTGDYFTLPGREEIIAVRKQCELRSRGLMPRAMKYGRILGSLPFIRMVALTGSLAVMNASKNADFDYMLITARGRVWTGRALALTFNRLTRLQGYTLCPNLIVSESALEWPLHDIYSARELCQMIPVTGLDVYRRLMKANQWVESFLPNAYAESNSLLPEDFPERASAIQRIIEFSLRGKPGDRFESWEMDRKVERFQKQNGFGEETLFNAEICQGNFHHHRKWTQELYEERLAALGLVRSGELEVTRAIGAYKV